MDNVKFGFHVILQDFQNFMFTFGLQAGVAVKYLRFRRDKVTVRKHIDILHQHMARVSKGLVPECIGGMYLKSSCRMVKQVSTWAFFHLNYYFIGYNLRNQHVPTIFKVVFIDGF
jgi:hypothetical protein